MIKDFIKDNLTVKTHSVSVRSIWNSETGKVVVYDKANIGKVFSLNEYSVKEVEDYIWELTYRAKNNLNANVVSR